MSGQHDLQIESSGDGDELVVRVAGELDMATDQRLLDELSRVVEETKPCRLVVDLHDVAFVDSSGISALLVSRQRALAAGFTFTTANAQPTVLRTLEIAGVSRVLGYPDD